MQAALHVLKGRQRDISSAPGSSLFPLKNSGPTSDQKAEAIAGSPEGRRWLRTEEHPTTWNLMSQTLFFWREVFSFPIGPDIWSRAKWLGSLMLFTFEHKLKCCWKTVLFLGIRKEKQKVIQLGQPPVNILTSPYQNALDHKRRVTGC